MGFERVPGACRYMGNPSLTTNPNHQVEVSKMSTVSLVFARDYSCCFEWTRFCGGAQSNQCTGISPRPFSLVFLKQIGGGGSGGQACDGGSSFELGKLGRGDVAQLKNQENTMLNAVELSVRTNTVMTPEERWWFRCQGWGCEMGSNTSQWPPLKEKKQ